MDEKAKPQKLPHYLRYVSPEKADLLSERIVQLLVVEKKFLDKRYSARQLAADLKTNSRYVSIVFRTHFHANYNSYVNKLRIDKAMSVLLDRRYTTLSMQDISDMVGFSNRQSFYTAFSRQVGMTPTAYRAQGLEK